MFPTSSFYAEDTARVCFNNTNGGRWGAGTLWEGKETNVYTSATAHMPILTGKVQTADHLKNYILYASENRLLQ